MSAGLGWGGLAFCALGGGGFFSCHGAALRTTSYRVGWLPIVSSFSFFFSSITHGQGHGRSGVGLGGWLCLFVFSSVP